MRYTKLALILFLVMFAFVSLGYATEAKFALTLNKKSIKNIEYSYTPLDDILFFLRQVKKCTIVTKAFKNGVLQSNTEETIELKPGERIANQLSTFGKYEWGFLFYGDDRGLGSIFANITSAKPTFDSLGRLTKLEITGTLVNSSTLATLTRSKFKYDGLGRIRAYESVLSTNPKESLSVLYVAYDAQGKIASLIFREDKDNNPKKWLVYSIVYNGDGDILGWTQQLLASK